MTKSLIDGAKRKRLCGAIKRLLGFSSRVNMDLKQSNDAIDAIKDYVVIGAGSAGCVLVNRLSKDPEDNVLLLEAGGPDTNPDIHQPTHNFRLFGTEVDWLFSVARLSHLNGRHFHAESGEGAPRTDSELRDFIRNSASTFWHVAGTCKMGRDACAVVDPQLRARGLKGLRVADASIMPTIVSGKPNAAWRMIGEKAADMILSSESV